ncbi:MAG: hypothetical protein ACKOB4_02460 [Acidobacteriota bacterium]
MIPELRQRFNTDFSEERYRQFLDLLESEVGARIGFRPCETPVFLPPELVDHLVGASLEIISQLDTPHYRQLSTRSIPDEYRAPREGNHPHFVQIDFALCTTAQGRIVPRLIELQGCASLYAYQQILAQCYRRVFNLDGLRHLLGELSEADYLQYLRDTILRGHAPEEVVLMEIDPLGQKTLPDFLATEKLLGVRAVCISDLRKRGRRLYYQHSGREIQIRRIYNRVIIDELVRREMRLPFDLRDDLDVEWAGHPNWYFRWSKFSLPHLDHPTVPRAWFLDQLTEEPANLRDLVLKPLFSFAGAGVKVGPTTADLAAIPVEERGQYLLQERVDYAPLIRTPDEPSRVEVRVMILWPENGNPIPVTTLTRLSKGLLMGVNFNMNKTWVGSSIAFYPDAWPDAWPDVWPGVWPDVGPGAGTRRQI